MSAISFVAVIALAVVVTVLLVREGPDSTPSNTGPSASGNGSTSNVASANDTGPAGIITQEPTCARWVPINNTLADREKNGWNKRDPSVPATAWTLDQRSQFDAVAAAMRTAADQTMPLIKLTPHRVVRELYEQFIAYSRAYADKVTTYTPQDDHLARVSASTSGALGPLCYAITYGSAASAAAVAPEPLPPSHSTAGTVSDTANPQPFISTPDAVCADWTAMMSDFDRQTAAWQAMDPAITATQRTPDQNTIMSALGPVMNSFADKFEQLSRHSANATLQDVATLGAQYIRAFAAVIPSYIGADGWVANVGTRSFSSINQACLAAGT